LKFLYPVERSLQATPLLQGVQQAPVPVLIAARSVDDHRRRCGD